LGLEGIVIFGVEEKRKVDLVPFSPLNQLFAPSGLADFMAGYFSRFPTAGRGGARELASLLNWEALRRVFSSGHEDILIAQGGRLLHQGKISFKESNRAYEQGATIVLRHVEKSDDAFRGLAEEFLSAFSGHVDIQLYATPASQQGFHWHYDAEDVFVLQSEGSKDFSLRKNSVDPLPLVDRLPKDMHFEKESTPAIFRCRLEAGDWLYIPAGYWHQALACEASLHISVGVLPLCAIDALDLLKERLGRSLLWRQRLPVARETPAAEWARNVEPLMKKLGQELEGELLDSSFIWELLERTKHPRE
jgi:50S ribosomal protein L16 3-hydroxylase